MMNSTIRPGQPWLDTDGKRIQAHGGSIMYLDGTYYWYGENKERTVRDSGEPGDPLVWHWGVRCYSSKDLCNWKDEGLIIPPDISDPESPLHPYSLMDRPHIIHNASTGKYVAWLKVMVRNVSQSATILTADNFLGPYTIVRKNYLPLGFCMGDFDLVVAPDGKAYNYFERVHSDIICAELTDDYTAVTGKYSTHFPQPWPPFVREAPAHFIRNGRHYLVTSGTTGYLPNPSEIAVADDWHGPYAVLGNPHPADQSHTSFHSQVSSVFKVPGKKDLYIACADRWLPQMMHISYESARDGYSSLFSNEKHPEAEALMESLRPDWDFTKYADYVWLPFRFDGQYPILEWRDEWSPEEFD